MADPALFDIPPGWVAVITVALGVATAYIAKLGRKAGPAMEPEPSPQVEELSIAGGLLTTQDVKKELHRTLGILYDPAMRIAAALEGILAHMIKEARDREDEEEKARIRREAMAEGERRARDRERRERSRETDRT